MQLGRQAGRQADRQTGRHTNKKTFLTGGFQLACTESFFSSSHAKVLGSVSAEYSSSSESDVSMETGVFASLPRYFNVLWGFFRFGDLPARNLLRGIAHEIAKNESTILR